jgi:hypothetical protein
MIPEELLSKRLDGKWSSGSSSSQLSGISLPAVIIIREKLLFKYPLMFPLHRIQLCQ